MSLNRISKGIEKDNLQTEVPQCLMFPKYLLYAGVGGTYSLDGETAALGCCGASPR